jgi:hypothetical protein
VARYRALAAVRRYAILGAALAAVLVVLDRVFTTWSIWPAILLPLALVAIAAVAAVLDAPSLESVARLADRRLDLKEQVSSALEVEEGQSLMAQTALYPRLQVRAASVLARARREWHVGLAPARYEWLALLVLCAAVAAATAIPHSSPSSVASGAQPYAVGTLPNAQAPVQVPLNVPDVSSSTKLPVHMNSAVVSAPAPTALPAKKKTTGTPKLVTPMTGRTQTGKPQVGQAGSATKKLAKTVTAPTGLTKGDLSGVKGGAQSTQKQATALPVRTDRHLVLPTNQSSKATGIASKANGTSGNSSSKNAGAAGSSQVTSKAVTSNSSQTRRGANGKAGLQGGIGGQGGNKVGSEAQAPNGVKMTNPYGENPGALGTSLPKPGLIEGKSSFSGKAPQGQNQAGSGAGSANSLNYGKVPASAKGKQLQLLSAYGASSQSGQSTKTAPGQSSSGSNGQTANVKGAGNGNGTTIDYVPPDANTVTAADRSLVSTYFTPGSH